MSAKNQLLAQYDLHNLLFNNVIVDINEEESNIRLVPSINNVKWLAGHLVWAQGNLARLGRVQVEIPWVGHFLGGPATKEEKSAAKGELPSLEMIRDKWNEIGPTIRNGLENLTLEALNSPVEFPIALFKTQEGLWTFINHHQAYTIGQIGILRRALGKEAMKYI
jgi:hypothetical protein